MISRFARQTVSVVRAPLVTDHGSQVPGWANATVTPLPGCSVQPGAGARDTLHRDAVRADLTVFAPPGSDIRGTDRIRVDGYPRDFVIVSGPALWQSATGSLDHVEVLLQAWEG